MIGLTIETPGAPYVVTDGVEKPTPGPKQVLVKSVYVGINPIDTFMQSSGLFISSWPAVIGCDASGTVVEVGKEVTKLKNGDWVWGCTRLGDPGYGTFQEYFLMDEQITGIKPDTVSAEEAAGLGVGTYTASLGLVAGLGLKLPEKGENPSFDEWVIILGGSGSVGQYAVQLATICGYKVLATCSPSNDSLVKSLGATATVDYKLTLPEQLAAVEEITKGDFGAVLDATAASTAAALEFLTKASKLDNKRFATVDNWTVLTPDPTIKVYRISLGQIGKEGAKANVVTNTIATYVPYLETYLEEGKLKANEVHRAGEGWEAVSGGIGVQNKGAKGGRKVVVKVGEI